MQFVAYRLRDESLHEDVVQETMARLVAYGRRKTIGNWTALAKTVALNLIKDHFRNSHQHPTETIDDAYPCENPSQEQVLMHRQRLAAFRDVLATMPPLRREVLIRRRLREQSYEEIGRAMNLSPQAVEKHMTRALRQLHQAMLTKQAANGRGAAAKYMRGNTDYER